MQQRTSSRILESTEVAKDSERPHTAIRCVFRASERTELVFGDGGGFEAAVQIPSDLLANYGRFSLHYTVVTGSSMEPTLQGNDARWWKRDIIWVNRIGLNKHLVKNEVAVFVCPRDPKSVHVKRIIATEDKLVRPVVGPPALIVPQGSCWVQSDNPANHNDSNAYGPVPKGLFIGRVTRVLWPLHRFGKLPPNPHDRMIRPPGPAFTEEEDD
ncbi:hypothetical protein QR680_013447 [Steinernema hermaphroditum]|uniref:Mitochondrial inner membrane protease subunit 2 n=1 Tax=Steinernema hermaphroditum TaxID=289476 RepID=A0AA39I6W3_9BILA|nr:hypothetical protein QR680_013447 [Steinernema hermaphroditum]